MRKYNKIIIYYFTGTGNSLKAGQWISDEAKKKNIQTQMYSIDNNYKPNPDELDKNTLIGFLSPTHGFNIAPAMLRFILKFPSGRKADVFILNTRGSLKLFKFFSPGISGAAQYLPMMILKLKGYRIAGGLPLDMPSNWLFLHSGLKPATVDSIVKRCDTLTRNFINNIFSGQKDIKKMLVTLPLDLALMPITLIYFIFFRFVLAKTMIYTNNCNSCMICVDNCPVNAIKIVNNKPYWTYSCEGCMRCINTCPRTSIQSSHLIFLMILIIPGIIFNQFILAHIHLPEFMNYQIVISVTKMALTLAELFLLYAVIQRFLKYKYFGIFFKYTSFTTYWRRYLATGITIKNFKKEK